MGIYRKRPPTIEAEQWLPVNLKSPTIDISDQPPLAPGPLLKYDPYPKTWSLRVGPRWVILEPGDWIIKVIREDGVDYKACANELFLQLYEEVDVYAEV